MLSDHLAESADEVRRYLREFPDTYREIETEAQAIVRQMDALRCKLDAPWLHNTVSPEA